MKNGRLAAILTNNLMTQKQLNMVGYLIEIFYDLCLAPGDNVSMNPGFERCLLDFSRDKDI